MQTKIVQSENLQYSGVFHVYDNLANYSQDEFCALYNLAVERGASLEAMPGIEKQASIPNIIMASAKLEMVSAVFPNISKLVITNQTDSPTDSETSYTGTIYQTVPTDEYYRSGNTNPFLIGWNIANEAANGTWGSLICLRPDGTMINRTLANITKASGAAKLVMFSGSVS